MTEFKQKFRELYEALSEKPEWSVETHTIDSMLSLLAAEKEKRESAFYTRVDKLKEKFEKDCKVFSDFFNFEDDVLNDDSRKGVEPRYDRISFYKNIELAKDNNLRIQYNDSEKGIFLYYQYRSGIIYIDSVEISKCIRLCSIGELTEETFRKSIEEMRRFALTVETQTFKARKKLSKHLYSGYFYFTGEKNESENFK